MSFVVHTFETNSKNNNIGFSLHEDLSEGRSLYFLAKFPKITENAEEISNTIFNAIVNYCKNSNITDPYDLFEEALKSANQETTKLRQTLSKNPEIVVALFDFHHLFLSQCGDSEAYLFRNSTLSQITEIPENGDDIFLNILSGTVMVNDIIILSSNRILRVVTANQLTDILHKQNFAEAFGIFKHEMISNQKKISW